MLERFVLRAYVLHERNQNDQPLCGAAWTDMAAVNWPEPVWCIECINIADSILTDAGVE